MSERVSEIFKLMDITHEVTKPLPLDGNLAWISLWKTVTYLAFLLTFLKILVSLRLFRQSHSKFSDMEKKINSIISIKK